MVRCAMCDSPATRGYYVEGQGFLRVCESCREKLAKMDKERITGILKKIIMDLNQKLAKVPTDKTPGQTQYNRGMRVAFKLAVEPVEKALEELIKE